MLVLFQIKLVGPGSSKDNYKRTGISTGWPQFAQLVPLMKSCTAVIQKHLSQNFATYRKEENHMIQLLFAAITDAKAQSPQWHLQRPI